MKTIRIKVQVTPEQSKEIQEAIFKKGGSWARGDAYVKYQAYHFLVIEYGYLTYCVTEDDFYEHNGDVKQVFARDALALIKGCKAIKPAFVVDIRGGEIAVRKNTPDRPAVLDKDNPGLVYLWFIGVTTQYTKRSGITTLFVNEYRQGIEEKAHKLCAELNDQKGED